MAHGGFSLCYLTLYDSIGKLLQFGFYLIFQRATLAEKEVSALKEQLAVANNQNQSDNKMTNVTQGTDEMMNRSNIELELSAKEREVISTFENVILLIAMSCKLY